MSKDVELTSARLKQELAEIDELESQLLKVFAERNQTPARVGELLRALYERATAHFEDEATGVIHDAAEVTSEAREQCGKLCRDHGALKSQLDQLMRLTEVVDCTPQWWDEMETTFKTFAQDLTKHDAEEKELIDSIESEL